MILFKNTYFSIVLIFNPWLLFKSHNFMKIKDIPKFVIKIIYFDMKINEKFN